MEKDTWNIFSRVANRLGSMPSNLVSGTKFNRIREKGELERAWKETVLDASEASLCHLWISPSPSSFPSLPIFIFRLHRFPPFPFSPLCCLIWWFAPFGAIAKVLPALRINRYHTLFPLFSLACLSLILHPLPLLPLQPPSYGFTVLDTIILFPGVVLFQRFFIFSHEKVLVFDGSTNSLNQP